MNQADAMQALQVALEADVPALVWGEPGSGKTSAILAMAAATGRPVEVVLASLREPSDFAGLPIVVGHEVTMAPPDWARRLAGQERAICFFDEISTAAPSTQKALLRVVHERVVGDLALGHGVRMVAAANPAESAAGGWDLTPPLANRFVHIDWSISPSIVSTGLLGHWPEPAPLAIDPAWPSRLPHVRSIVAGFLAARPGLVHARPADGSGSGAGRAWPSPRSWDALIRMLAVAAGSGISAEARLGLISGSVGDGAALELVRFERDLDLPDPEQLLADPAAYARPARDDQVHAVVAAVTSAVLHRLDADRWTAGLEVLGAVAAAGNLDIAANGVRVLAPVRPPDARAPASLAVFRDVLVVAGLLTSTRWAPRRAAGQSPQ